MSIENVERAVLAEAEREAAELLSAARARLAERVAAAEREIAARIEARRRHETARLEEESARDLARARSEGRLDILAAKNRLIEDVFRRAIERLAGLPREKFQELARRWLSEVPPDVPGIIVAGGRERAALDEAFLAGVNAGRTGRLELSPETLPEAAGGGLAVRAGRFEYDFTWAGRLADRRDALTGRIAADLFGQRQS